MTDLIEGDDGLTRCSWGSSTPEYRTYHDSEWGRPVGDDARVYEKLCLEGFQAGLSWLTILRKRDGFRQAFASFDPAVVAGFDEADVDRLVANPSIVRHRPKIVAAVANARATVALRHEGISLAGLVWKHGPAVTKPPKAMSDISPSIPESKALSTELRRHGFAFVGPTTVYAAMQALGVVNDHLHGLSLARSRGGGAGGVPGPERRIVGGVNRRGKIAPGDCESRIFVGFGTVGGWPVLGTTRPDAGSWTALGISCASSARTWSPSMRSPPPPALANRPSTGGGRRSPLSSWTPSSS